MLQICLIYLNQEDLKITDGGVINYPDTSIRDPNYSEDEEKPKKNVTPNFTGKRTERNI